MEPDVYNSVVLLKYRQRMLQDTRLVKVSGVSLPRDPSGRPLAIEFPLNHVYTQIQAIQEPPVRVPEDDDMQSEYAPLEQNMSGTCFSDILNTLSHSGEELYRQGVVYRDIERPDPINPESILSPGCRIVILGAAGSGKTTLLQYLAYKTAREFQDCVPVLVNLQDYALYLSGNGAGTLDDFAIKRVAGGDADLRYELKHSAHVLWLVDGLDEAYPFRDQIVQQLNQLSGDIILTSRPIGYQKFGLETFAHFEVLTMTSEEVDRFIRDWFIVLSKQIGTTADWVEERTRWLKTELMRRPYIQTLASNPLLLTSLVILSGDHPVDPFPERRTDLYADCVKSFWDAWDQYLRSQPDLIQEKIADAMKESTQEFRRHIVLQSLYYVGWYMHIGCYEKRWQNYFTRNALTEALGHYLDEQRGDAPKEPQMIALVLVDFWQQVGVLDVHKNDHEDYLTFRSATFREYAVAHHLAADSQYDFRQLWDFLAPRLHHFGWREPILMMIGLLDEQFRKIFVNRLLRGNSAYEQTLRRDLRLVASLLGEHLALEESLIEQVLRQLSQLSGDHQIQRLITLILIYVFGAISIPGALLTVPFHVSWIFLVPVSLLWTLIWIAAFVTYEIPDLQQILAFPVRMWNYLSERNLIIRLLGQDAHAETIGALMLALKDHQAEVRRFAAEALGQIAEAEAVPALLQAMHDQHEHVRKAAAMALGRIGAIPRLVQALNDPDVEVRNVAAETLRKISKSQAIPNLALMLKDHKDYVRKASADTLKQINDNRIIPPLVQALKDNNKEVRLIAVEALGEIGERENLHSRILAVPGLTELLNDPDRQVRWAAAYALGRIRDPIAVPALVKALKENKDYVKRTLADALRRIATVQAVPYLVQSLSDSDADVRAIAAEALGRISESEPVSFRLQLMPDLINILQDRHQDVRRSAAEALGRMKRPEAIDPLLGLLLMTEWQVWWTVAEALGQIGDPKAIPALIQLLNNSNGYVCRAAIEALGKIGGSEAVPYLIQALKNKSEHIQQSAAKALKRIGEAQTVPYLIHALKDEQAYVRKDAEEALKQIGDMEAMPYLIQALQDQDEYVRKTAAETLGRIGDVEAVPHLIQLLDDQGVTIRGVVLEALGLIGSVEAIPGLIQALRAEQSKIRVIAAKALGRIGSGEMIAPLIELLKDQDVNVRRAAVEALGRIGDDRAVPCLIEALHDAEWWVRCLCVRADREYFSGAVPRATPERDQWHSPQSCGRSARSN
jgi:HEAT repeat protein